jgi:hypothetical protein
MLDRLHPPKQAVAEYKCSVCGVDAGCNCGAPVVPKQIAQNHFEANPGDNRSNRTIAEELGVGKDTVRRAKLSIGAGEPIGSDARVERKNGGSYSRPSTIDNPPRGELFDDQGHRRIT